MARHGRRFPPQKPRLGPYIPFAQEPSAGPIFTGLSLAARRKGITPRQRPQLLYPQGIVGPPPPPVSLPRYPGCFVYAKRKAIQPKLSPRLRLERFRLTPAAGFLGAKTAYLTVVPTRSVHKFTVVPTRRGQLGVV